MLALWGLCVRGSHAGAWGEELHCPVGRTEAAAAGAANKNHTQEVPQGRSVPGKDRIRVLFVSNHA